MIFDFLVDLFGDHKALSRAIDKTNFLKKIPDGLGVEEDHISHLCSELMLLADISNNKVAASDTSKRPYSINLDGIIYNYQIEIYDFRNERLTSYLVSDTGQGFPSIDNFDIKIVIQTAYYSYLKLEKHY